jgi:hypothetical protein
VVVASWLPSVEGTVSLVGSIKWCKFGLDQVVPKVSVSKEGLVYIVVTWFVRTRKAFATKSMGFDGQKYVSNNKQTQLARFTFE